MDQMDRRKEGKKKEIRTKIPARGISNEKNSKYIRNVSDVLRLQVH
jgi:hypothetical protein